MTEREKMLSGALYNAGDKELAEAHMRARRLCRQYNELPPDEEEARDCVRMELLGGYKRYAYMEPPVWFDYGCNLFVGENFYANYNLTVLDCARDHWRQRDARPKCFYLYSDPIRLMRGNVLVRT